MRIKRTTDLQRKIANLRRFSAGKVVCKWRYLYTTCTSKQHANIQIIDLQGLTAFMYFYGLNMHISSDFLMIE